MGTEPDQRTCTAFKCREHEFPGRLWLHPLHGTRFRIDQLGDDQAAAAVVQPTAVLTFAALHTHFGGSVQVARDHAPRLFELRAIARYLQPGFARKYPLANVERFQI